MKTVLIVVAALAVGFVVGTVLCKGTIRYLRRRVKELRSKVAEDDPASGLSTHEKALYYKMLDDLESGKDSQSAWKTMTKRGLLRSVTEFLFVTAQIFALGWVSVSYGIAVYSTVVLMQPFPVTELSQQAIDTILKVVCLKVIGNIFEHNDGPVFGTSSQEDTAPADDGSESST